MKKIILTQLIMIILQLLYAKGSYSQIVYEHTYPFVYSLANCRIQLKDIGNGDYKYIYTDYSTNELKIFNIDHTPFLTIPITEPMVNEQEYVIGYVTKSLFDCDTSMIEYALMPVNWRRTLYILRQDGTILFSRDSTIATYCVGCFSGSYDVRPIVNTPSGAKLFLAKNDNNGYQMTVDVYSLCGTLPMEADPILDNSNMLTVFPNPAHKSEIYFKLNNSNVVLRSFLEIYDSSNRLIKSIDWSDHSDQCVFDGRFYGSGLYYYRLISNKNILQSGKFIIN